MNAIHSIRLNKKKRRKRKANYDNILNFLKQIQENVDIKTVKLAIKELIDDNKICSKGQVGKENYFLSLQLDKNIQTDNLENTFTFIDEKYYEIIKNKVSVPTECSNSTISPYLMNLIDQLKSEIAFLRQNVVKNLK